jgi:hypothetical protein
MSGPYLELAEVSEHVEQDGLAPAGVAAAD